MADYSEYVTRISAAARAFDRPAAEHACGELMDRFVDSDAAPPAVSIVQIMTALRNKRYFDLMERVGDAAILCGQNDPTLRRLYAQGLVDQGRIAAALDVLTVLEADTSSRGLSPNPAEHAEARGLIGRAHKQAYVNAGSPSQRRHLARAIDSYSAVYSADPARHLWHGINAVACLCRAERDRVETREYPDPRAIARDILATITAAASRKQVALWDRATAGEACIALDRLSHAREWLTEYAGDEAADAFELGSTLRQLTEVWQLTPGAEPGTTVLPILQSALLLREGGRIDFETGSNSPAAMLEAAATAFEVVLGDTRFVPLRWYRTGLQRCAAVARIETPFGQGFGTGFLVRGEDLHPALAGEAVLITNAHVVNNDPRAFPRGTPPHRARVRFEARDEGDKTFAVKELLWSSPPNKLDASVLRLETSVSCDPPYPLAVALPVAEDDRVYVIGHPQGGTLSISIQDNRVIDVKEPKLHYRAPTEPGSSGSPVFNQDWELVALHHAGSTEMKVLAGEGVREANEGIWISSIVQAMKDEWKPAGHSRL